MIRPPEPLSQFPDMDELIPHRSPMRWVDELILWDDEQAVCKATIRASIPLLTEDRVSSILSLEYFAQTAAAWFGYKALREGKPFQLGVLCGVRELTPLISELKVDDEVYSYARKIWNDDRLAQFTCRLECKHQVIAQATISVMQGMQELQR